MTYLEILGWALMLLGTYKIGEIAGKMDGGRVK